MRLKFEMPIRAKLNTLQAARYLGVNPQTLRDWRKAGMGPRFIKYGPTTYRYDLGVLEAWLASHARAPGKPAGPEGENVVVFSDKKLVRDVGRLNGRRAS